MNFQTTKSDILYPLTIAIAMSPISVGITVIILYFTISDQGFFYNSLPIAVAIAFILPIIFGFPLVRYFIFQQRKIEQINDELSRILRFDNLTGILTRKAFFNETVAKINAGSKDASHAALFLDIDQFKKLNDTFGHALGDKVLKLAGEVLNKNLTKDDVFGRLGGEEFVIFLSDASENQVQLIAYKVLNAYKTATKIVDGHTTKSTLSIGAAISKDVKNIDSLLAHADQLLYQAKSSGRNQIVFKNIDVDTIVSNNIVDSIVRKPRKNKTNPPTQVINAA